jgi:hypothetical protein
MPLEDAVPLIMRNFEAYMRGEKLAAPVPTPISVVSTSVPLSERHPEAIQVRADLTHLAAETYGEHVTFCLASMIQVAELFLKVFLQLMINGLEVLSSLSLVTTI